MALKNKQFSIEKEMKCKPHNEVFAGRLNDAIIDSNLSRKELSSKTGIGENLISDYISGEKSPSYLNFQTLAKALSIPYEFLYGETTSKKDEYIGIERKLGLSDKSIRTLIDSKTETVGLDHCVIEMVNALLENRFGTMILNSMWNYLFGEISSLPDPNITDLIDELNNTDNAGEKLKKMINFNIDNRNRTCSISIDRINSLFLAEVQQYLSRWKDALQKGEQSK